MGNIQKKIEIIREEIITCILTLMRSNSVSEITLTETDNPVFIIWFDKTGEPCECRVHKVIAADESIFLEVYDKITGETHKITNRHETALANPVCLNEMLEAIKNIEAAK